MLDPLNERLVCLSNRDERGQGLVEYMLILALVALLVVAALSILGPPIANTFNTVSNSIS